MKKLTKGAALIPVIVVVAVAFTVGAVAGVAGTLYFTRNKGGLGEGKAPDMREPSTVTTESVDMTETADTEPTTEPEPTEAPTEPVTDSTNTINVTVAGNNYLYNGERFDLPGILAILRINETLPVKITDDNASLKAYNELTRELDELHIRYMEDNE